MNEQAKILKSLLEINVQVYQVPSGIYANRHGVTVSFDNKVMDYLSSEERAKVIKTPYIEINRRRIS